MVSEAPVPMAKEINMVAEKPVGGPIPNIKNHGRIPKKIHKAVREKLKRDHLNDLFLELGNALEPARQNSGKASILGDANRLLRDLFAQVERLKRENTVLLSEYHYVTIEKNELRDENSVIEAEIENLRTELQDRAEFKPTWSAAPAQLQHKSSRQQLPEDCLKLPVVDPTLQLPPVVGPVFVIPLHHETPGCSEPETAHIPSKPPSKVSRPHARYPTPSDSWPSQILAKQRMVQETELTSSKSTNVNGGGQVSDNV